ncbi:MAG TPA: hypothetical protein VE198_12805, partial [Actinoallomurus sp.]|nr:hypothetical protein [Actinoallomurus sp.]
MSGNESAERSEEDSAKDAEESEAPADAWTNTPPAPAFPQYPGPPAQDPPAEGQQPYGYGFPGYPPQDFGGVHQPPQFPGVPGQEYGGGYPPYPPPEQAGPPPYESVPPPYEAMPPNGTGSAEAESPPPAAEPEEYDEAERTQYVEQRPPAETTQLDGGYEGYNEGGHQGYAQPYPAQQFGPPPGAEQAP